MKSTIIIAALLLSGCGTMLENRVACTVDGKEAHFISKWGPTGIATKIADGDAKALCKR